MENKDTHMKHPKFTLAVSMIALAVAGGSIQAQDLGNNPFKAVSPTTQRAAPAPMAMTGDDLGSHIAGQVLNMNGYNITNLKDPFFEGDAVTLDYFNKNNGWDQIADGDIDMSGFTLKNLGDLDMEGRKIHDGALDNAKVVNSTLSNSIITKSTIDSSEISNPQVQGGVMTEPTLRGAEIIGGTARGLTLSELILDAPEITGAVLNGGEMVDATLDAPVLHQPTINGGVLSQTSTVDATHKDSTFQGDTLIEGGVDVTGNRITGAGDAAEDTDVMNLRSTRAMIEDFIANMEAPPAVEVAVEKPAAAPALTLDMTALSITDISMGSPVEDEVAVEVEVSAENDLSLLTKTENGFDLPGDLHVSGNLVVSGALMNVPAIYRPTPSKEDALGLLDGADTISALSNIAAMVYNLPDGGLAMGIDPGTIPAEMGFVMKAGVGDDGAKNESIDYVQLISPMIAAIQTMDARITELEAQIGSAN